MRSIRDLDIKLIKYNAVCNGYTSPPATQEPPLKGKPENIYATTPKTLYKLLPVYSYDRKIIRVYLGYFIAYKFLYALVILLNFKGNGNVKNEI